MASTGADVKRDRVEVVDRGLALREMSESRQIGAINRAVCPFAGEEGWERGVGLRDGMVASCQYTRQGSFSTEPAEDSLCRWLR